jgi:phenylpropionate dioxygenase-like ring-hydroxylating dioxygenase large terminal subunit
MIMDQNNPNVIQEAVPVGLSQLSHLPNQEETGSSRVDWDGNWKYPIEELSDEEDCDHTRKSLSWEWNESTEAIHNSRMKQSLEDKFRTFLCDITAEARGTACYFFIKR